MKNIFLNSEKLIKPIWIFISAFLVLSLRFNRWTEIINTLSGSEPSDDLHYIRAVNYFRHENFDSLVAPFSYRPLAPFLASKLPFDAETSLNLLNGIAFLISVFIIRKMINEFKISGTQKNILLLLFIFSFPAFYYSVVGYLDIWILLFTSISSLLAKTIQSTRTQSIYLLALFIATFFKESVIFTLPFVFFCLLQETKSIKKTQLFVFIALLLWIISSYLSRHIIPTNDFNYTWLPSIKRVIMNANRPRAIPSLLLSIGIQGFWFVWLIFRRKISLSSPFSIGFFSFFSLWVYSFLTAYANGRFIWPAMVFSTLGIAHYLSTKSSNPNNRSLI